MSLANTSPLIEAVSLARYFQAGESRVYAVQDVSLRVHKSEWLGIIGPSGCGKSTLLNMLGLVDTPSSGFLKVAGEAASGVNEKTLERIRKTYIGYVFQSFNLLSTLNVTENIMLPCLLLGDDESSARARAEELLRDLGLVHRANMMPSTLSGGEMQRVAIARAIAHKPKLILADEPTGNLDSVAGEKVLQVLCEIHQEGTPIVMVTHSESAMSRCSRVIRMQDGAFVDT